MVNAKLRRRLPEGEAIRHQPQQPAFCHVIENRRPAAPDGTVGPFCRKGPRIVDVARNLSFRSRSASGIYWRDFFATVWTSTA